MREILFRAKAINRVPGREYRTKYKNGDFVYGLLEKPRYPEFPELPVEIFESDDSMLVTFEGFSGFVLS